MAFYDPDPPEPLTTRQMEAMHFINWYMGNHEYRMAPRLQDICDGMGLRSVSSASKLVGALVKKGYLSRSMNVARGLTVTDKGREFDGLNLDMMDFLKTVWALDEKDCTGDSRALVSTLKSALRASGIRSFRS